MRAVIRALLVAAMMMSTAPWASAAEEADRAAIKAVIEQQLDAFQNDDAAKAYGLAAPGIKRMFPNESAFMAMVRDGYGVVYRHKGVLFGPVSDVEQGVVQAVQFTDED